ncbi:MAG: helix-turn-helix domain-containing protein [Pseudomonadota bacterium]
MVSDQQDNFLLSREDIERAYGISRRWLELAAHRGDGPPMVKISSRMVRYRRGDLEAWLAAHTIDKSAA